MKIIKPLAINRSIVGTLYILAFWLSAYIFYSAKPMNQIVKNLSLGAILASFGSSLIALGSIFIADKYKRVIENIDILYKDIYKINLWKRWPFLKRKHSIKLLNSDRHEGELSNPEISFDVGTHQIQITIPTALEDFFDLPNFQHYFRVKKYYKAFLTKNTREDEKDKNKEEKSKQFMSYLCVYDILKSIVIFRLSRFITHFGIGLIFSSILFVILNVCRL